MAHSDEVVLDRIVTVPNLISTARIALIPVFGWAFLTGSRDTFALILLIVIGCSDWVDGYVARKTGQVSKLGKLLDPVADRIAIVIVLIVLTFRGVVDEPVAAALLGRDLIVSIVFPILESRGFPRLAVNQTGKWATALIFFGMGFAAGSVLETPVQIASGVLSQILLIAGAVLYWTAGVFYVREIRKVIAARSAEVTA
ncbi:MAG: CDP-alcohol phosphatidyltransferase family protein [Actinomycetota bacterium]